MNCNNFIMMFLLKLFLIITKYYSIFISKLYNFYMYLLKHISDKYLPVDNNIYINTTENLDEFSSSDDEDYHSKFDINDNVLNLNNIYFTDMKVVKNVFTILKNNIIRKTIIYAELVYKKDNVVHNLEFTKKFKIFYTLDGSVNINTINKYFDNPFYLFVFFFCFETNELKYKIIDLRSKRDIIDKRNIMFGKIKI